MANDNVIFPVPQGPPEPAPRSRVYEGFQPHVIALGVVLTLIPAFPIGEVQSEAVTSIPLKPVKGIVQIEPLVPKSRIYEIKEAAQYFDGVVLTITPSLPAGAANAEPFFDKPLRGVNRPAPPTPPSRLYYYSPPAEGTIEGVVLAVPPSLPAGEVQSTNLFLKPLQGVIRPAPPTPPSRAFVRGEVAQDVTGAVLTVAPSLPAGELSLPAPAFNHFTKPFRGILRPPPPPPKSKLQGLLFDPRFITDFSAWYDFSKTQNLYQDAGFINHVTADGQPIGGVSNPFNEVFDLTQVTGASATRPTYKTNIINGLSVARFDGNFDFLETTTWPADSSFTVFIVAQKRTPPQEGFVDGLLAWGTEGFAILETLFWPTYGWYQANGVTSSPVPLSVPAAPQNVNILALRLQDASTLQFFVNGNVDKTVNPHDDVTIRTHFFVGSDGSSAKGDYDVGEIIVYSSPLSTTDLDTVGGYLAGKWGVPWSSVAEALDPTALSFQKPLKSGTEQPVDPASRSRVLEGHIALQPATGEINGVVLTVSPTLPVGSVQAPADPNRFVKPLVSRTKQPVDPDSRSRVHQSFAIVYPSEFIGVPLTITPTLPVGIVSVPADPNTFLKPLRSGTKQPVDPDSRSRVHSYIETLPAIQGVVLTVTPSLPVGNILFEVPVLFLAPYQATQYEELEPERTSKIYFKEPEPVAPAGLVIGQQLNIFPELPRGSVSIGAFVGCVDVDISLYHNIRVRVAHSHDIEVRKSTAHEVHVIMEC